MAKKRPRSTSAGDCKAEPESSSCSPDAEDVKNKKKLKDNIDVSSQSDNKPVSEETAKRKTGSKRKRSETITNDEKTSYSAPRGSEKDVVVSAPEGEIKKKKRKAKDISAHDQVNGTKKQQSSNTLPVKSDGTKSKKAKKKKNKKKKQGKTGSKSIPPTDENVKASPGSSSGVAQSSALDYLRKWKQDRDGWTFQKVRQVWLLQHIYDTEKIGTQDFVILVEYLENLKGQARQETIDEAEKLMNESEEDSDNKPGATSVGGKKTLTDTQFERIRQVLQMLS